MGGCWLPLVPLVYSWRGANTSLFGSVSSTCMVQMVFPIFLGEASQWIVAPVAGRRNSKVPLTVTQGPPQLEATAEPATENCAVGIQAGAGLKCIGGIRIVGKN